MKRLVLNWTKAAQNPRESSGWKVHSYVVPPVCFDFLVTGSSTLILWCQRSLEHCVQCIQNLLVRILFHC